MHLDTKNLGDNFWGTFIIFTLCYGMINFLFLPHNSFISYPIQGDDYHAFIFTFNLKTWTANRPVFYFLAPFFAQLGITGYYLLILSMVILYAVATFRFARIFFSFILPIEWLIFYATIAFSFSFIIDVTKFLGTAINLCSTLLGLMTMLALLKGHRENKNLFLALAGFLFTFSIFTKEDFILMPLLLSFYLLFFEKGNKKKLCFFIGYSATAVAGLFLFNKFIAHSVFTGMGAVPSIPYKVDITLYSIFYVLMKYLTLDFYTKLFSMAIFPIASLCIFFAAPPIKIKILFFMLCIIALILPYSLLPNHIINFYSYNWIPWEAVLAAFGLFTLTARFSRKIICIFLGILSLTVIIKTHNYRDRISQFYNSQAVMNKNIASTLLYYKPQLNKETYIGIVGIEGLSPWADGEYLRKKLSLTPKWIVFVDKSSVFFTINADNKLNPHMLINILDIKQICDFPKMKYLYFKSDGKGKLIDDCKNIAKDF